MGSHQISIKTNAYDKLKIAKNNGESFTDIILRLLDNQSNVQDVLDCYGISKCDDPEEERIKLEAYKSASINVRKDFRSRFSSTIGESD